MWAAAFRIAASVEFGNRRRCAFQGASSSAISKNVVHSAPVGAFTQPFVPGAGAFRADYSASIIE
jgi:hypothetical protein